MPPIYEIYYENKSGDVVFCSDHITSEMDARDELRQLGIEFPENSYYYETIYEDEEC